MKSLRKRTVPPLALRILTVAVVMATRQQTSTSPTTPSPPPQAESATPQNEKEKAGTTVFPAKGKEVSKTSAQPAVVKAGSPTPTPASAGQQNAAAPRVVTGGNYYSPTFGGRFGWMFGMDEFRLTEARKLYADRPFMLECLKTVEEDLREGNNHEAATYVSGGAAFIVFWRSWKPGIIAHESFHAVSSVLRHVCIEPSEETEEVTAYMLQELVEKITESYDELCKS